MARHRGRSKGGGGGGGGHDAGGSMRWLLTYADMITLLTAFFLMMYSMSVVNIAKFNQVAIAIRSGFGGELEGSGHAIMSSSASRESSRPAIIGDVGGFQSINVARQMREYIHKKKLDNQLHLRQTETGLVISLVTDKVLFKKGETALTPEAEQVLHEVASLIRTSDVHIRVEGHTDNLAIRTARFPSNWELSAIRATTVVRYLVEREAFDSSRLEAAGYADSRPIVPNDSEVHRAYNRRVDMVLLRVRDRATE